MENKNSSRWRVLDAIELMVNQIAIVSHCQEVINELTIEYNSVSDPEDVTQVLRDIVTYEEVLTNALESRRDIQKMLMDEFSGNKKAWCLFKHAVAAYWYATEVKDATPDAVRIQQKAYEDMIRIAGIFFWVEVETDCARCLFDQLLISKK